MINKSILLFCGLMSLSHATYGSNDEVLGIKINGVLSCQGSLMFAVYDNEHRFMKIPQAVTKGTINLATADCSSTMVYNLPIPYGQYAVLFYHDANNNGILDKNAFGMPTEMWGVSNNARPFLRAPKFKESAFTYNADNTTITINIQ